MLPVLQFASTLLLWSFYLPTDCFNIDVISPVFKFGSSNTSFGFSVAQHFLGNQPRYENAIHSIRLSRKFCAGDYLTIIGALDNFRRTNFRDNPILLCALLPWFHRCGLLQLISLIYKGFKIFLAL